MIRHIDHLPKNRTYSYIDRRNRGQIEIVRVERPEGPVIIKRYNPHKGGTPRAAREASISHQMLWRVANAFAPGLPINFDRVLGASYNTRSVLEALIAHTPLFYFCYPGRIETISSSEVKRGHKHLIWAPENPHKAGVLVEMETNLVISEVPSLDVIYDALVVPDETATELDIDVQRRHAQIQIALLMVGQQLGFRTWIAQNDRGIIYQDRRLAEHEGVIARLEDERLMSAYSDAIRAALLIDCVWFKNSRLMPAVIEIEHSTGVVTGLSRMKHLQDCLPAFPTRYAIAAPDEDREKVIRAAAKEQFRSLAVRFFPYSAVEELYSLCQRRKIRGVSEEFLDSFMEPAVAA